MSGNEFFRKTAHAYVSLRPHRPEVNAVQIRFSHLGKIQFSLINRAWSWLSAIEYFLAIANGGCYAPPGERGY